MRHSVKFIFIATIVAIGMPTTEYAIPKLSPRGRENARKVIVATLKSLYQRYETCFVPRYEVVRKMNGSSDVRVKECDLSHTELQQDIETSCALLDTFPSVLISSVTKRLNRCDDASAGLRENVTTFRLLEHCEGVCGDCLSDLFVTDPSKAEEEKTKELKVLKLVKSLWKIRKLPEHQCERYKEQNLLQKTTDGYKAPDFFGDLAGVLANDVYAECYAECLRKCSKKVQTYHRMFLFFDKEIPETDAALFYGEEVFRAFLRYERIKRDIENKTIDNKTYRLVGRFNRLAEEICCRRDLMVSIAEAALKKAHFKSLPSGNCSAKKLPNELKGKIEKEIAFIDRMKERSTDMRNKLHTLWEPVASEQTYGDHNWWKPANLIGEKDGRKLLEEIE